MKEKTSTKESRFAVAFRAHEERKAGCARVQWVEVYVVASERAAAVNTAKQAVRDVKGLTYEGTS